MPHPGDQFVSTASYGTLPIYTFSIYSVNDSFLFKQDDSWKRQSITKLFRGRWVDHDDWVELVRKLEAWPIKVIPVRCADIQFRLHHRKLPSWSANRWKSLT
jgi:hypothetical protein